MEQRGLCILSIMIVLVSLIVRSMYPDCGYHLLPLIDSTDIVMVVQTTYLQID
jgi:hypothetical protein